MYRKVVVHLVAEATGIICAATSTSNFGVLEVSAHIVRQLPWATPPRRKDECEVSI